MRSRTSWLLLTALLLAPASGRAQEVRLQIARGPYYVGTPVDVTIVAEGFSPQPEPTPEVDPPQSGTLRLLGVTPNRSSSVMIINGQVQRSDSVQFLYRYQYLAAQPGRVEIGPFRVRQAGTERSTAPYRLEVRDVPTTDRVEVELRLGADTSYVGARIPVVFEYRIDAELERNLVRSTLQVPALGMRDAFRIEPSEVGDQRIEIATPAGPLELLARVREQDRGSRRWLVVSIEYAMIPLRPGRFEFDPSSITLDAGVRFRRDVFGRRNAEEIEKLRALDRARTLEVEPVPRAGRPPSFAGAVGRGFSLEVRADRSVVQVGDPIALTFTLRGDGPLDLASLPALQAEGLLPEADFSVPDGELTGQVQGDAKTFDAVIRAKREQVSEIPALAYSYFDPETARFETIRSQPIALSVRPARMVGATQVVVPSQEAERAPAPKPERDGDAPLRPLDLDGLGGLDLSIVREPERLLGSGTGPSLGGWGVAGLYVLGVGLVLGAWLERQRRDVDPERARLRAWMREHIERAERAAGRGDLEALAELASLLRAMRALAPESHSDALERFLAACDEQVFAPRSGARPGGDSRALAERGLELAREIARRAVA